MVTAEAPHGRSKNIFILRLHNSTGCPAINICGRQKTIFFTKSIEFVCCRNQHRQLGLLCSPQVLTPINRAILCAACISTKRHRSGFMCCMHQYQWVRFVVSILHGPHLLPTRVPVIMYDENCHNY